MPAASILSDDWERRAKHREDFIAAVKRSGDYAGALAATSLFPTSRPTTPNPRHPDQCSRRVWERSVRQWRQELRALLPKLDAPSAALVPTPMKVPTTAVPPRPVEGRPPFELSVAPAAVMMISAERPERTVLGVFYVVDGHVALTVSTPGVED